MPFEKGKSGNPAGRPPKSLFADALRREIAQRDLSEGIDGATLRKIVSQWVDKAIEGDVLTSKEIRDTLDGKPAQAITGPDGGPLQIEKIERVIVDKP